MKMLQGELQNKRGYSWVLLCVGLCLLVITGCLSKNENESKDSFIQKENEKNIREPFSFPKESKRLVITESSITFNYQEMSEIVSGEIENDSTITINYDSKRLPNGRGTYNGLAAWSIICYYRFGNNGEIKKTTLEEQENTTIMLGNIKIPSNAEKLIIWFYNSDITGFSEYDSNNSQDYYFDISKEKNIYFRGTPNNWGLTKMISEGNSNWYLFVDFSNDSKERFKIDVSGDWTDSYPDKDYYISDGKGKYKVIFNEITKEMNAIIQNEESLVISPSSASINQGDLSFSLPKKGSLKIQGLEDKIVNLNWTPNLDVNKLGSTKYTASIFESEVTSTFELLINDPDKKKTLYPNGVFFRGAPNNWGKTEMNLIKDYTREIKIDFNSQSENRFKIDVSGNWTISYPDKDYIISDGDGNYLITFYENDKKIEIFKNVNKKEINFNYFFNDKFIFSDKQILTQLKVDLYKNTTIIKTVKISEDIINNEFFYNNSFNLENGNYLLSLDMDIDNFNYFGSLEFKISDDSQNSTNMDFIINKKKKDDYNKEYNQVYIRGTNNEWFTTPMKLINNNIWEAKISFSSVEANGEYQCDPKFKFDIYGDWSLNFGDSNNDGIADNLSDGNDIIVNQGNYKIKFNDKSKEYNVEKIKSDNVISIFGSSVARGYNSETVNGERIGLKGYAYFLEETLQTSSWDVVNQSIGGDTTGKLLNRFNDVVDSNLNNKFVVIGLSLSNEGIMGDNPEGIFNQYKNNLQKLITQLKNNNINPIIGLCYANSAYNYSQYKYIRDMNILVNSWDVPSINFLGGIDDGFGKWAKGYYANGGHPNRAGHEEMFYTIVPSLFDAIENGKSIPLRKTIDLSTTINSNDGNNPFTFESNSQMHSYSLTFSIKTNGFGYISQLKTNIGDLNIKINENGYLSYKSSTNEEILSNNIVNDNTWQNVTISYRFAKGETLLFLNGYLLGTVNEKYLIDNIVVGGGNNGSIPSSAEYKDLFIHRASLNNDEINYINNGNMIQSSLEFYSPLNDITKTSGFSLENLAQSYSKVIMFR